jgi:hypothetical protein
VNSKIIKRGEDIDEDDEPGKRIFYRVSSIPPTNFRFIII